mgnify:CR=1 FL=1
MNASDLQTRTWEALGNNFVFYQPSELFANGINPALRLLVLLKPDLLTRRVTIPLLAGQLFYDLRTDRILVTGTVTAIDGSTQISDARVTFSDLATLPGWRLRRISTDATAIITSVPDASNLRFTGGLSDGTSFAVGDAYQVELRTADCWRMERVLLGGMTDDDPVQSNDQLKPLTPTTLASLRWHRRWYQKRGTPRHWFLHGWYWLCIWPRPEQDEFVTLVYRALPTELSPSNLSAIPDIPTAFHDVLPHISAAMLLSKEGGGECQTAASSFSERLGAEPFAKLLKAVRGSVRDDRMVVGAA